MARILRFLFILLFPSFCFADGVSVQSHMLQSMPFAFLVKLIALDSARHLAKVKVLKKYVNPVSLSDVESGLQPSKAFDNGGNVVFPSVEWSALEKQEAVVVRLKARTEPRAGKWVIEESYWDTTTDLKPGNSYFIVNMMGYYQFVPHSKDREVKFDLVFDLGLREAKLKKIDLKELCVWLKDQDLRAFAFAEMSKRNEFKLSNILIPELKTEVFSILLSELGRMDSAQRKVFLNEGLEHSIKELRVGRLDSNLVANFTKILSYYPEDKPSFDREAELMGLFIVTPGRTEARAEIDRFHYDLKTKLSGGTPVKLETAIDQVIKINELMDGAETSSAHLNFDLFFEQLKGEERLKLLRKMATGMNRIGHNHRNASAFHTLFFELRKTPDLETAKILMKMNHQDAQTAIKVPLIEAVYLSFEGSALWQKSETRKEVLDFMNRYINPKIPNFLSDEIMKKYRELSGGSK